MKDDKKKTEAKEAVVEEDELSEEDLDKASGGVIDPTHPPHIQPDGRYFPPCYD